MSAFAVVKHETFELQGSRSLFAQAWRPDAEVRGVIGIIHGLGEHSSRYAPFAERLARVGFRVVAYDQCGHGRTGGKRGDAPSYDVLLDDIQVLLDEMTTGGESLPMFLFGQSFGGTLVLTLALRRQPKLSGIVVSSPLLLPVHPPPRWKEFAGRMLQRVWPTYRFGTGVQSEELTHDPDAIAAHKADPLVHHLVSARVAVAMLDAGEWALDHAAELNMPALLMHGTADPITSAAATIEFARRAGSDCTLRTFPGLYHELHWEREHDRDEAFQVVLAWLEQRIAGSRD